MLHEIWSQVGKDWRDALGQSGIAAFERLSRFLQSEAEAGRQTYPAMGDVFKALRLTPLREVKLLILGQGPYFGEAHGLSFRGMRFPMFGALTTADIERVRFEDGAMTVAGRGISPANCNPLGAVVGDPSYELSVEVETRGTAQGGLLLFYSRRAYCGLGSDGSVFAFPTTGPGLTFSPGSQAVGRKFQLRLVNDRDVASFYYGATGGAWVLFRSVEVAGLNHNVFNEFLSLRPALYAAGEGEVQFSNVRYRALS